MSPLRLVPRCLLGLVVLCGCGGGSPATDAATDAPAIDAELPPDTLLQAQIANQVMGRSATVSDDGTVARTERTCCPPEVGEVASDPLDAAALAALRADIAGVAAAGTREVDLGEFALGATTSSVFAVHEGRTVVVRSVENRGGRRVRTESEAASADAVVALVEGLLGVDLD